MYAYSFVQLWSGVLKVAWSNKTHKQVRTELQQSHDSQSTPFKMLERYHKDRMNLSFKV